MTGFLKMKLMALITAVNAVVGVGFGYLLYLTDIDHYFRWYPSIPVFYWITAIAMVFFLDRVKRKKGDVTVTTYMVVRLAKFSLALLFLCLYAFLVGEQFRAFGFTMMLFYFIYLGMETYSIYLFEKKRMKMEKREAENKEKNGGKNK